MNECLCKVRIDSPVAFFVGVGKGRSFDRSAEPRMVELLVVRRQADFDVAKALPIGELSKGHREKLVPTRKLPNASISIVALDTATKLVVGKKRDNLSKNGLSLVHSLSP